MTHNDDILETLMTSDFNDEMKPGQWRTLLLNFRYFYKLLYGKYKQEKDQHELMKQELERHIKNENKEINQLRSQVYDLNISNMKLQQPRKLTWRERIKGETMPQENQGN